MGCFSWLCCFCDEQILGPGYDEHECYKCYKTIHGTEPTILLMPDDENVEGGYDNYGCFGCDSVKNPWGDDGKGLDAYAWVARANMPELCASMLTPTGRVKRGKAFWEATRDNTNDDYDRSLGINLHFDSTKDRLKYPLKACHTRCEVNYWHASASPDDSEQGWQNIQEEGNLVFCEDCDIW